MEISGEIIKMIADETVTSKPISGKSHLFADLVLDSLSFVSLLIKIEERYSISFEITEMENCLWVERLIDSVEKKAAEANRI